VPSLQSSINKYLTAVRPLLNSVEFENAQKKANELLQKDGIGEKLQKMLVDRSKTTENWVKRRDKMLNFLKVKLNLMLFFPQKIKLSQWWYDKIYLEPRYSVVINVNPGSLYPKADYSGLDEQLVFATKYIFAFLDFKNFLEE
jgi:hypothetical protein